MSEISVNVITVVAFWISTCIGLLAFFVVRWRLRRSAAAADTLPVLLINGVFLLALAPVISVFQFVMSDHRAFWGGGAVLLCGFVMIGTHFVMRPAGIRSTRQPTFMPFREKSVAAQFTAILIVYGYYGARLWGQPLTAVEAIATLIGITVLMILIMIASHIALRLYAKDERRDERDAMVELRGSRNAYRVLATGVWCVLLLALAHVPYGRLFYAIMAVFALAELVRLGSQLIYYRLGS